MVTITSTLRFNVKMSHNNLDRHVQFLSQNFFIVVFFKKVERHSTTLLLYREPYAVCLLIDLVVSTFISLSELCTLLFTAVRSQL